MKYWIPIFVKFADDRRTAHASIVETFDDAVKNAVQKHSSAVEYYNTPNSEWVKI